MKRIKMGIIALAAITGIGGAFAFSPKPLRADSMVYYGFRDSNGDGKWTLTPPSGASCQEGNSIACTITSTSDQTTVLGLTNAFPAQYSVLHSSDNQIYRP
jgi:hypothetical protein